ncbi:riboflavin synthase [Hyperthermus butylicus]|uniref:Riboflavin synthase n=1 Tax=Hyperthermus butylicus (strain DSM 5456 / JCM 9403 / PLM1-5) TaxID=415426 RepID=A2BKA8_HYPBU|nr:riboflavin synthase [Hyperthermus butylicus DSM 5456]
MKICIVDTTFARIDMARYAIEVLQNLMPDAVIVRRTVPGIKDIPVEIKTLMQREGCEAGMVFGWVGRSLVDKISYAVYSLALQLVQLELGRHIIDVTVHEDESESEEELYRIAADRARKHAENLYLLLRRPEELVRRAGTGRRQGYPDAGPIMGGYG